MDKEDILFQNRMEDLAMQAYQKYYYKATDFLNNREQDIVFSMMKERRFDGVAVTFDGGYEEAERRMVIFHMEDMEIPEEDYPLTALQIRPKAVRFAEPLEHRDILGALMHLGIERSLIGDILVQPVKQTGSDATQAILFCKTTIAPYIMQEIQQIRHTMVELSMVPLQEVEYTPSFINKEFVVASLRVDAVFSTALKCSRSTFKNMVTAGNVVLNHRELYSPGILLKENDIISIRGYGKYRFNGMIHETKKGRLLVAVQKYN